MWLFVIHCFLIYAEYTDVDCFFGFFLAMKKLCIVSLELTFLTDGRALVPYEISGSSAAGEDENVP